MRPRLTRRAALTLLLALLPAAAPARTPLQVVTALELEQLATAEAAIEAAIPEVEIAWDRASTGVITDRVLAGEAGQPDLAFGLAVSSLLEFKRAGLLAVYRPAGAERLRAFARDPDPAYAWTGMDAYLGVICFNADLAERNRLSRPTFWRDLLDPRLKGRVVMPDPVRSGTGYLIVAGWLRTMGEEAAWAFMDRLHENVAAYLPSGTAPCREASTGRQVAGLSFDMRAAAEKAAGAPVDIVVPVDGTGWDQEGFAVFAAAPHPELARRVADWAASREADQLYARHYAVVAYPGVSTPTPIYPPHAEARMIRSDPAWMAENRARILAEWRRRYGAKAQR